MPQVDIRDARTGDEPDVQRIVSTVLEEFGMVLEPAGLDADLHDIVASYFDPGGVFLVVMDAGGAIVGCAGLCPLDDRVAEIRKVYLLPPFRGMGLGKQLTRLLVDAARAREFERVVLETASVLTTAVAMYEHLGFREIVKPHCNRCDRAFEMAL